ncbi:uncharacterized protein METZ01_LOCUS279789, partial [marine metagenome]
MNINFPKQFLVTAVMLAGCTISPKETLPGTYALDEGGVIVMILRKNGTVENYTLGEFDGGKKTYKTVGKEVHILDRKGTSVFKIEPNGDLTLIAKITKGKREKLQEEAVLPPWKRVSDPSNPQNAIVEHAIREALEKPEGELITKADLEKVRYLQVTDDLTDEGLKEVAKLQQLTGLSLYDTKITDAGLKDVAKMKQLEYLGLASTQITDAGLKEVAKLRKLTELEFLAEQITDAGLKEVAKLQKLTGLALHSNNITDAGLKELAKMKQLESLGLDGTQITDAGLKEVAKLQNLTFLDLTNNKITDVGLKELAKMKQLESLGLDFTKITDAGLKEVVKLQKLTFLGLNDTKITDAGVAELKKALPKCNII